MMKFVFPALVIGALTGAAAFPTNAGAAGNQAFLTQAKSWKRIEVNNKWPTEFRFVRNKMEVIADKSVAFLYREVSPIMGARPKVEWQWRIDKNIPATDQAKAGSDDRPLAVHLWFDDTAGPSLFGSISSLLGRPRVGHLITYVWGGRRASGTILRNPYYPRKGALIILRNAKASTSGWQAEKRDIVSDFRQSFGKDPNLATLRYVSVSGDTDDTKTLSKSQIRAFRIAQ